MSNSSMIDNQYIFWILAIVFSVRLIMQLVNILAPNRQMKRLLNGKDKLINDNLIRFVGVVWLFITVYVLLWLIGYVQ